MLQFGRLLQHILSQSRYSDLHGTRFIEQDAERLVPELFGMIALNPHVMKAYSRHIDTNEPLSDDTINQVLHGMTTYIHLCISQKKRFWQTLMLHRCMSSMVLAENYMRAIPVLEEIVLASFDLEIHMTE